MDPGRDDLAADDGGGHAAKQRQAGGEILRAIHRVDHEGEVGAGQGVKQAGIAGGGFLADHDAAREAMQQAGRDDVLGRLIGIGHEVERPGFGPDGAGGEAPEARQDFGARGFPQQRRNIGERRGIDARGHAGCSNRARSAALSRTVTRISAPAWSRATTSPWR